MVEEALAAADRHQASLRTQVQLLKQSHAAAQEEITRLRSLLTQRNVNVPPILHFPHRRRPESYYVGDAQDPDSERTHSSRSSGSSELRQDSPRGCAENVPTQESIGESDWVSFDMVATIVAGPHVDRIGVGFLNLPPVPLVVKRVTRGSWADQQGIQCGDEFMSVDHRRSRAFTPSEFTAAMKKRPLVIKLRRTARKGGAEAEMQLRGFGVDAIEEEQSDSEGEEEEEEESDSEVEDMCPEKAKEVAEKLAREVEENARKERERLSRRRSEDLTGRPRRASTGSDFRSPSRSNSFSESFGSRAQSIERRYSTGSDQYPHGRFSEEVHSGAGDGDGLQEWSKPKQLAKDEWMVQMLQKATSPSSTTDAFSTSVESTPASMAPTKAETEDEFF